jgi:SAM-dependent methyltransferase
MDHEGMVHALEEIHRLLRSDGVLIEIHPVPGSPLIEVRSGADVAIREADPTYDYEDDLLHAEQAVDEIVQRGRFDLGATCDVDFVIHASSVEELREYWAVYGAYDDTPKDDATVARENELYDRMDKIMARLRGRGNLLYTERARLSRLDPIHRPRA